MTHDPDLTINPVRLLQIALETPVSAGSREARIQLNPAYNFDACHSLAR